MPYESTPMSAALRRGLLFLLMTSAAMTASAAPSTALTVAADDSSKDDVRFSRDVLPILSEKCFVCHGPDAAEVGPDMLRLDSADGATADRGGYRAIDRDDPSRSELLDRIHSADAPMPPADADKQLTPAERAILTRWVEQGGAYSLHWAFQPPERPPVPRSAPTTGAIDAFVGRRLDEAGVTFAEIADPAVLARRVSLVLTGLPPEPQQLRAFLNDTRPDAWERLVDSLLDSPRFGEHQARYWLDAVRYGDTHGLHLDNRRGIYPWRDWVVRSINQNLPVDDFITWQLAGDLLPDPTLEQRVATGFVRMNPTTSEGGAIPAEFQAKNNFDRVETLGTVLLGMSLTCARCHTHKYDPIQQTEYYELLAFFNSTAESALDGNKYDYAPVIAAPADQSAWDQWQQLQQERTALLVQAESLPSDGDAAARLAIVADPDGPFSGRPIQQSAAELAARMAAARDAFTTTLVAEELAQPRVTRLLHRGEYDQPVGDPLEPGVPAVMGTLPPDVPRNRLGLARWLTSPEHPLVARVLVNRLWQQVFGFGLVRTPEDFGVQGQQPTHPELLDWLARELVESGWDRKHLLRLMVTSRTFRQSSAQRDAVDDPENRLFARGPSYRLDAEVLRDIGLWASGLLDPHMGGEGVKPYQPPGLWAALAHPASNTKKYERDAGQKLYRRSLYVYWKRTSPHPMMILFDAPDRESSCVRRSRTNTPLQSLGLLNETQRIEIARTLAVRLLRECETDDDRLQFLWTLLASRGPTDAEAAACESLLQAMRARYAAAPEDARALLAVGDNSIAEDADRTETAAWTQVTTVVLASDAAIMLY